jgi:hypothetical protein
MKELWRSDDAELAVRPIAPSPLLLYVSSRC